MDFEITPMNAPFGAIVTGLDMGGRPDPSAIAAIGKAFVEHVVLCFKDQRFEAPDDFLRAASHLGEPMPPVTASYRLPGYEVIEELRGDAVDPRTGDQRPLNRGGSWHTDHSNLAAPPKATVLYAIEVPELGGNTEFTNLQLAFEALPEVLARRVRGRRVFEAYLSRRAPRKLLKRTAEEAASSSGVWQPLVRRHPDSGRAGLYFNPMRDDAVEGLSQAEGDELLDAIYAHCDQPGFQYSHQWTRGDMLIWDNRAALHQARFDFDPTIRRYLHRIMLRGDEPVAA